MKYSLPDATMLPATSGSRREEAGGQINNKEDEARHRNIADK
jgi:hypothetical protein